MLRLKSLFFAYKCSEWIQLDGAVWFFFLHHYHGLSPGQATSLFGLMFFVSMLLEMPTGSWADRFGRRRVLLLAHLLLIAAYSCFVFSSSLTLITLGFILRGAHSAAASGCIESLLYDELKFHDEEKQYKDLLAYGQMTFFIGRASFMVLGAYLYSLNPLYTYSAALLMAVYLFLICFALPEHGFTKSKAKNDWHQLKNATTALWRNSQLREFLLLMLLTMALGNMIWFQLQPFFDTLTDNYVAVGWCYALIALASAFGSRAVKDLQVSHSPFKIALALALGTSVAGFSMGLSSTWWHAIPLFLVAFFWGCSHPLVMTVLNQQVESDVRATSSSMYSQLDSISIAVFGGASGYLVSFLGTEISYSLIGLAALLIWWLFRRSESQ